MSLLDSCFSQASRSRSRVRRAGLALSATRKERRGARHVPRTRSPARAQLVVRNATQPLNSLVSDTCHCCHCCCCCLRIMTSCCCCVCCSDAGSSECQARPACTEHDYVEYMKPCEDNQVRTDSLKHHILLCFRTLFTMFFKRFRHAPSTKGIRVELVVRICQVPFNFRNLPNSPSAHHAIPVSHVILPSFRSLSIYQSRLRRVLTWF